MFSEKNDVEPRYDQKSFDIDRQINTFVEVFIPYDKNDRSALWVYQQTYLNLGIFEENKKILYSINSRNNGVYLFLINGEIEVDNQVLSKKDAIEITDCEFFNINVIKKSTVLLIEVPIN